MKKSLFNMAFLSAALFTVSVAAAQDEKDHKNQEPKYKKSKSFSKSYSLGSSDRISLNNQFGEMKLVTWEKNEIKVDVSITGKSDEESRAQQIIDRISINDGKDGNTVYFKTKFADENKVSNKDDKKEHRHEGMEINYLVYLPSGNALSAENQFGKMIIPDYRGEAELECKFGSLTAGKLTNAKEVNVEFGEANIAQVSGGKLSIKFSQGTVEKLSGDIRTNLEFSQVKLNVDNDVKALDLHNSYSTVYLDVDKNFSATYDIQTSHGDFSNKTAFAIKKQGEDDDRYGPRFNNRWSGTSGSGSARVKINSSFGQIIVGHNLQVDLSEKKKHRSNTRVI